MADACETHTPSLATREFKYKLAMPLVLGLKNNKGLAEESASPIDETSVRRGIRDCYRCKELGYASG